MPRAAKPTAVLKEEKKSHRTKAELQQREESEKALLSGSPLFERDSVKKDPVAHTEFTRLEELMKAIDKNDALYAPAINRYCELYSEEQKLKEKLLHLEELFHKLEEKFDEMYDTLEFDELKEFTKQFTTLCKQISSIDAQIMHKRNAQGKIESENCMTVAAALRSIPKAVVKEDNDVLAEILAG